jgi:PAS domain S-box-containing protein
MNRFVETFFRFPDSPQADHEFVKSVLNSATVPIVGLDRRMHVHMANLQAEEMLLRLGASGELGAVRALPPGLKRVVGTCLKRRSFRVMPGRRLPGLIGDTCDLLITPGRVAGVDLAFLVMLNPAWNGDGGAEGVMARLLGCFRVPAMVLDGELRFRGMNDPYLATFSLNPDEAIGRKVSELNPSKQAEILENQIRHVMEARQVRDSKADRLTTAKRGVVLTAITAWPLYDGPARCVGLATLVRPVPDGNLEAVLGETGKEVFGTAAVFAGPPMFLTHLDGRIIVANATARRLMTDHDISKQPKMAAALRWVHPEIIEKVFVDMIKGSDYSAVLTDVDTPAGRKLFRVTTYGLKEIGNITSEVLFHMVDVTDAEHMKNQLADTARNLAAEKEILDKVIEKLPVPTAYAVVDRELRILRVSTSVSKSFGIGLDQIVGKRADEIDPSTRTSGIITYIKTAMERGREIHIPRFDYKIPGVGREVIISLSFYPIRIGENRACVISVQNVSEAVEQQVELRRKSRLHEALFDEVEEGVAVIDPKGLIVDVNPVIAGMLNLGRDDLVGRHETELMEVEERDLLCDFRRRAMLSRKPLRTGCIRLRSRTQEKSIFVDISFLPLIGLDGSVEEVIVIVRFLTSIKELEHQIEEYTENLEKLVRERTHELSAANLLLGDTVRRLASMAESGIVLSSLKDSNSVMASFLEGSRDVLGADFVSVALVETQGGTSKTTYYSVGDRPPAGAIPSDAVEESLARLTLKKASGGETRQVKPNLVTVEFVFTCYHGLLIAWKRDGEFTSIESNLSRLLCNQLGFSLPVTDYVADLRLERDRSQVLRRIAFRVAGVSSVAQGIAIVAEELSKTVSADRFYWVVSDNRRDIWVSEVYRSGGKSAKGRRHLGAGMHECLKPILEACSESHSRFCHRFPGLGREDFVGGVRGDSEFCPFALEQKSGVLTKCMKSILRAIGLLGPNGGSLTAAPVVLSQESWGMLCAYNEVGIPFLAGDACFMCLAASTVGRMWEAADTASNLRRLESAGETVSELAHDLKYPLMRMRELISNVSCCDPEKTGREPAFSGIRSEIDRLALLAQELIDISNSGKRMYELVDVVEILNHCVSLTATDSDDGSVGIKTTFEVDLPPVFANRKDIKTVLLNILANCLEAAGAGGQVEIAGRYGKADNGLDCVRLTFEDSGPGVAEADRERIFDPYFTSKEGGSGLGLFSAKKRAKANAGDVVCEQGENGRSRFTVWFPTA